MKVSLFNSFKKQYWFLGVLLFIGTKSIGQSAVSDTSARFVYQQDSMALYNSKITLTSDSGILIPTLGAMTNLPFDGVAKIFNLQI
jgi:hypothetical protein